MTDPVLSTAEREAMETLTGKMSEAAWVEAGRQGLVRRPISASDERTQAAKVDAVVRAALAARDFYGPERVAELEQERDEAREQQQHQYELGFNRSQAAAHVAAEQRERVLREALERFVAEVDRLRGPHADPLGVLDASMTRVLAGATAALTVSPEQPEPLVPLDDGMREILAREDTERPKQHCTVEGDILGTGDDNSAPGSATSPEQSEPVIEDDMASEEWEVLSESGQGPVAISHATNRRDAEEMARLHVEEGYRVTGLRMRVLSRWVDVAVPSSSDREDPNG